MSQFPIYLSPQLLKPLVRRLSAESGLERRNGAGEQPDGNKSAPLGG
jgi:hypothetical protein